MKSVQIQGGLGNQLFGLAFAHSVASLSGAPAQLDLSGYASDLYGRRFETAELAAALGPFETRRGEAPSNRILAAITRRLPFSGVVREGEAPADTEALRRLVASGDHFSGYWQNEAFIAQPQVVRERTRTFLSARGGAAPARDVVVHLRTYKEERRPERRGAPGGDYFARAMALIEGRMGAPSAVTVISDDPAMAIERLGDIGCPVRPSDGQGAYADLALMLSARALILTNSSFSWWGGFCSNAAVAVYPRRAGLYHYPIPAAQFEVL